MESALRGVRDIALVKYSDVIGALSFALDMVEGQPEGHSLRSCFIGMTVANRIGLDREARAALFYALLLKDAGCSANSSKTAALFDADDRTAKRAFKTVDWSRLPQTALYAARTVSPDGTIWSKARRLLAVGKDGPKATRELIHIRCERGAEIARHVGFPEETAEAIRSLDEHWDGSGHPDGLKKDEIPLLARICGLAQTVEVFYAKHGPERAENVARSRRKKWFDPALVDAFLADARGIWEVLGASDVKLAVSMLEPEDRVMEVTPDLLDLTATAFARIIDAKSPFTFRHSEGVAEAALAIGKRMELSPREMQNLSRAALLHDVGKLGVSNAILDKPGKLTDAEFQSIKAHPRLTYEILRRVPHLQSLAETAANHHEKLDGSGYHRGVGSESLDRSSRILAVADIYDALAQTRPYRDALPTEKVLSILEKESGQKLCPDSCEVMESVIEEGELEREAPPPEASAG
ncbi:MAG: HD domain-containing protein [Rubrobacter sp.]|jgi:HD-GYP domain-containing protein (c-di-GMP phosphodiesterase class II)|nr:HD domain-containing protein [Rubrobacter sp.]